MGTLTTWVVCLDVDKKSGTYTRCTYNKKKGSQIYSEGFFPFWKL